MAAGTLDVGGEQGRGNPAFVRQRGLKDGLMLSRDIAVKGVRLKKNAPVADTQLNAMAVAAP